MTDRGIRLKRLTQIMLLVLSTSPAYAKWVTIGGGTATLSAYMDPETIRRKGNLVKIRELYDHKTIQAVEGKSFLSIKGYRNTTALKNNPELLLNIRTLVRWGLVSWCLPAQTNENGHQSCQGVWGKPSGH